MFQFISQEVPFVDEEVLIIILRKGYSAAILKSTARTATNLASHSPVSRQCNRLYSRHADVIVKIP